jgi:hypothetical protein
VPKGASILGLSTNLGCSIIYKNSYIVLRVIETSWQVMYFRPLQGASPASAALGFQKIFSSEFVRGSFAWCEEMPCFLCGRL